MGSGVSDAVIGIRSWLIERALPLWLDAGFDPGTGRFHERLDFAARPVSKPNRVMVQARQIYVYAHAALLGWCDRRDVVQRAFAAMTADYRAADRKPGWVFSVGPESGAVDSRRDFYAHAFVLLACAWVYRATGETEAIRLADETLEFLDRSLAAPNGGYFDDSATPHATRRQNPHMHLFESLLALFEATGEERFLIRADALFDLVERRFFLPGPDILAEYFDADWRPLGGEGALLWEPGHHCEWVWLLARYGKLRQDRPVAPLADALYARAYRDGITHAGVIYDEMLVDGRVAKTTRRAWPLTEAVKANCARHLSQDRAAADRASVALAVLQADFLREDGMWCDLVAVDGAPLSSDVPASTLYHLFLAIVEADQIFCGGMTRA